MMARGITKKAYDLLFLLKNNTNGYITAEEIAYATQTSVIAIYKMLDRLQTRGFIEKQKHGSLNDYTLTEAAQRVVKRIIDKRIAKPSLNMLAVYVRLHALAIKFPLIQHLSQVERMELLAQYTPKSKPMKNHTDYICQYDGATFKLTPSSLIAYGSQAVKPLGTPIPEMAAEAIENIKAKVYALEMQLQAKNALFKLRRKTKTINDQKDYDSTIIEIHIALTNDIFAKHATEEQDPYIIAMSEIDSSKVSLLADKSVKLGSGADSQGIPEVEGISRLTMPDGQPEAVPNMDRLARIYEAQAKGYLDPFQQQSLLNTTISTLSQLSQAQLANSQRQASMEELMVQYGQKLNAHITILEKMDVVLDQLIKENAKRLAEQPKQGFWQRIFKR